MPISAIADVATEEYSVDHEVDSGSSAESYNSPLDSSYRVDDHADTDAQIGTHTGGCCSPDVSPIKGIQDQPRSYSICDRHAYLCKD